MDIQAWATRWGIPQEALNEFYFMLGLEQNSPCLNYYSEMAISNLVRLEASRKGCRLWRNNVGALYTKEGRFVRYGLANDSTTVNSVIKSSDLIGIKPVLITPEMVGTKIGQFLCREVKKSNWKFTNTPREVAQLNWIRMIVGMGGDAAFVTQEGSL